MLDRRAAENRLAVTSDVVTAAQSELRSASRALVRLQMRLLGVIARLDGPAGSGEEEESPDLEMASEMLRTSQSVLNDYIAPAIDDLAVAARYRPEGEAAPAGAEDR